MASHGNLLLAAIIRTSVFALGVVAIHTFVREVGTGDDGGALALRTNIVVVRYVCSSALGIPRTKDKFDLADIERLAVHRGGADATAMWVVDEGDVGG